MSSVDESEPTTFASSACELPFGLLGVIAASHGPPEEPSSLNWRRRPKHAFKLVLPPQQTQLDSQTNKSRDGQLTFVLRSSANALASTPRGQRQCATACSLPTPSSSRLNMTPRPMVVTRMARCCPQLRPRTRLSVACSELRWLGIHPGCSRR